MVFERLPASVNPLNYKLQLQPFLDELKFDGKVIITLEIKQAVDKIILNAREIKIQRAEFQDAGDGMKEVDVEYQSEDERILFDLKELVQPGTYKLALQFSGILNDELRGFYRTRHTLPDKAELRNGALTHFEATGARRAFPCFDEPAIRATFDVTLVVPADRVALSNMPVKRTKPHTEPDWKVCEFETTRIMPTYLVAFVVGDYDRACTVDEDKVKVHVYTPKGKAEQGVYATQVAATTLPFYKKYFGVPYDLPKLDLVAAPDFAIGAMENWGLVIYREMALLVDKKTSSSHMKEYVALIIGHELAHNWFGNLVTMNWWTHLWLKEGFASWIEYLCVDHCFPEYDIWTQFVSTDLGRALKLDALDSSHPIEVEVGNPSEVDEIFDAISYSKGASIINMLHDYVGDDDFRKGLTVYLKRHKFSSACTEDLWRALEEASGKAVGTIMATWTLQKGYPVLKVTEKQEGAERVLEISQEKFSIAAGQTSDQLWSVPVSIQLASGDKKKVLMEGPSLTVPLGATPDQWVKVNAGTKGVYRVQYSAAMLKKLVPCIEEQCLGPTDRLGLISDLFALCEAGRMSMVEVLDFTRAFTGETNFTVWRELLTNLNYTGKMLEYHSTSASSLFHQFLLSLLSNIYSQLGWEEDPANEDHTVSKLRDLVVTYLGISGAKPVMERAFAAFERHVDGTATISSNMRRAVFATVMCHGKMDDYTKLKNLYQAVDSLEEKVTIAGSFGHSQDPAILQDVLKFAVSSVKSQDSPIVMGHISAGSAKGRELAWSFFKDNYQMLYQRYSSSLLLARLVKTTTEDFASEEKAVEIEEFFKAHPAPSAERTVKQSCEKIRFNAGWLQQSAKSVSKYLAEKPLPPPVYEAVSGGEGKKLWKTAAGSGKTNERLSAIKVTIETL